ncbi:MAG: hypothetical protein NVSMB25_02900 [Thermoleophilaceae bacterium]
MSEAPKPSEPSGRATEPASDAPEPSEPSCRATAPTGESERYGPLELRRYRKPDGRELILYLMQADDD